MSVMKKRSEVILGSIIILLLVVSCENFMGFEEVSYESGDGSAGEGLISLFGKGSDQAKKLKEPKVRVSEGEYKDKIVVAWQAVEEAEYYRVFRRKRSGRGDLIPFRVIKQIVPRHETSYEDKFSVKDMKRDDVYAVYEYKVEAFTKEGVRSASEISEGGNLLVSPRELRATRKFSTIKVEWEAARGAKKYKVYRSETDGGTSFVSELAFTLEGDLRYFIDAEASLEFGKPYYYYVVSVNGEEESAKNVVVMGMRVDVQAPEPPKVFASKGISTSEVELTWDEVGPNDEGNEIVYNVYRSSSESSRIVLLKEGVRDTRYKDKRALEERVDYYYYVQAIEETGLEELIGGYSEEAEDKRNVGYIFSSPRRVRARRVGNDIEVLWEKARGALRYKIYVSEVEDGSYSELVGEVGDVKSYEHRGVFSEVGSYGKLQFYKVVSVKGEMVTDKEKAEVSSLIPERPRGVKVSENLYDSGVSYYRGFEGKIYPLKVSWEKSWGAKSYVLWRSESEDGEYFVISDDDFREETVYDVNTYGMEAGKRYYYKVSAKGSGEENFSDKSEVSRNASNTTGGYGALSNLEFAGQWRNTIRSSHGKLEYMHNDGLSALGEETKHGSVSGKVYYKGVVAGIGAEITNRYTNYADNFFLIINGSSTTKVSLRANGRQTANYTITGMYEGRIKANLEIISKVAAGGKYTIEQRNGVPRSDISYDEVE